MGEGANPETCRHRVIEAFAEFGGGIGHTCLSCGTELPDEFFDGRLWHYNTLYRQWVQVGPTKRKN